MDAAKTNILSPDILPLKDLRSMFRHIESELHSTMHLPISLDHTLHFYWYLNKHVLIAGQFQLLINVPIHNKAQQLHIQVFPCCWNFRRKQKKFQLNEVPAKQMNSKQCALQSLFHKSKYMNISICFEHICYFTLFILLEIWDCIARSSNKVKASKMLSDMPETWKKLWISHI